MTAAAGPTLATLGLVIENGQVVAADVALTKLGASGDAAATRIKTQFDKTSQAARAMGTDAAQSESVLRLSLQRTVDQIREMQDAWRGARIGDTEFVQGVKRLQVEADQTRSAISRLIGEQEQLAASTAAMSAGADGADLHIGRLRGSLGTLAAQALGTNPAIIQASSALALLGVGSVVTVGVLAGIAAVATALDRLGAGARKAESDYNHFMDSLRQVSPLAAIGGQLDAVQHKLDNLHDGFLGAATRVTRAILSRSVLGQMFGVESEDELKAEAARLGTEAATAFQDAQRAAREKVRADLFKAGLANEAPTQGLMAGFQVDQIQNIRNVLKDLQTTLTWYAHPPDRNTIFKDLTQQGQTAAETVRMVNAAINSGPGFAMLGVGGQPGGPSPAAPSSDLKDNWDQIARAIVASGQAMGGLNDSTALFLQNAISAADAVANIGKSLAQEGGKVAAGDIVALIGSAAGILSSIFSGGESAAQRRSREIQEQNTEAIRKLTDVMTLQVTGTARITGTNATNALLGPAGNGIDLFASAGGGLDITRIKAVLAAQGTSLAEFQDFAKSLGITLDTTNAYTFIDALKKLDEQLGKSEVAHFADTFAGQMQLLAASFKVFNTTDALDQLTQTVDVLTRTGVTGFKGVDSAGRPVSIGDVAGVGSPAFAAAFQGLNLALAADRAKALKNLQDIFLQIRGRTFDTTQTGGLTLQQFVDQITGTIDILRQVEDAAKARDQALQATVDSLRNFSDSLKLSNLSTLSPVQQLEEARRQYQTTLTRAQGGDQAAAAQLPDAARQFLTADRAVNASGSAFAADFARVLADSESLAQLFAGQQSLGQQQLTAQQGMQENTAAIAQETQVQTGILAEGFSALKQQQAEMQAAIEDLIRETRQGFEGGKL